MTATLKLVKGDWEIDFIEPTGNSKAILEDGTFTAPPPERSIIETGGNIFRHGADIKDVTWRNREVSWRFRIEGIGGDRQAAEDQISYKIEEINRWLAEATLYSTNGIGDRPILVYQWDSASKATYFDVLTGYLSLPGPFSIGQMVQPGTYEGTVFMHSCEIRLTCLPFAYSDEYDVWNIWFNPFMDRSPEAALQTAASSGDTSLSTQGFDDNEFVDGDVLSIYDGVGSEINQVASGTASPTINLSSALTGSYRIGALVRNTSKVQGWYQATGSSAEPYTLDAKVGVRSLRATFGSTGYVYSKGVQIDTDWLYWSIKLWYRRIDTTSGNITFELKGSYDDGTITSATIPSNPTGPSDWSTLELKFNTSQITPDTQGKRKVYIKISGPDGSQILVDAILCQGKQTDDNLGHEIFVGQSTGNGADGKPLLTSYYGPYQGDENGGQYDNRIMVAFVPGDAPAAARMILEDLGSENKTWWSFNISMMRRNLEQRVHLQAEHASVHVGSVIQQSGLNYGAGVRLSNTAGWQRVLSWHVDGSEVVVPVGRFRVGVVAYNAVQSPHWQSYITITADADGEEILHTSNKVYFPPSGYTSIGYGPFSFPPVGIYADDLTMGDFYIHLYSRRESGGAPANDLIVDYLWFEPLDEFVSDFEFPSYTGRMTVIIDSLGRPPSAYKATKVSPMVGDPYYQIIGRLTQKGGDLSLMPRIQHVILLNSRGGYGEDNALISGKPYFKIRPQFLHVVAVEPSLR